AVASRHPTTTTFRCPAVCAPANRTGTVVPGAGEADAAAWRNRPRPVAGGATVQVNDWLLDSAPCTAVAVTAYTPAVVGVPAMRPVGASTPSPGGRPTALYASGSRS